MCKMLYATRVTGAPFQQNGSAPKKGAAKRPHGGKMHERSRDRRVSRDIEGEECGEVPLGGIDVFSTRPEAHRRVRRPMAPQDTPERGAKASRHRRPTRLSGDPAGVSKHPPNRNGGGFAAARLGLDTYPPSRDSDANPTRFRKAIDAPVRRSLISEGGYPPDHPREVKHKK